MAWVKIDDRNTINLDRVDTIAKVDALVSDTTYKYYIYFSLSGDMYQQKFDTQEDRDYIFGLIEAALDPIKDEREV